MGFSWSLYFVQTSGEAMMRRCRRLKDIPIINDNAGPAVLSFDPVTRAPRGTAWYLYVDNLGILSARPAAEVSADMDEVISTFEEAGLSTHESSITCGNATTLGTEVRGESLSTGITQKRFWRVQAAVRYALQCKRLPGRIWEIIIGHLTFCGLVKRESLCVFHTIYPFIANNYYTAAPLWPSARGEIETFLGLMFLGDSQWSMQWSTTVGASDASETGMGVCTAEWPRADVIRHGRVLERARFRRASGVSARDAWFAQNGFTKDSESGLWRERRNDEAHRHHEWEKVRDFPEIEVGLLQKRLFTVRVSSPFKITEGIVLLEARALFRSLQVIVSLHHIRNSRVLLLTDNHAVCLAFERKRAHNFRLLVQISKIVSY